MLDSRYVHRVVASPQRLGIPFEHRSLPVFGGFDEFQRINPPMKVPTPICDVGEVLIDSTLILQDDAQVGAERSDVQQKAQQTPGGH